MANKQTELCLRQKLDMSFCVLSEYSWLLDSYILDFFLENHVQNLPKCWIRHFQEISVEELGHFLDPSYHGLNDVWPLSLIILRFLLKYLCFPRKLYHKSFFSDINIDEKKNKKSELVSSGMNYIPIKEYEIQETDYFAIYSKLKNLFIKHVKKKKRYEILKMAQIAASTAYSLNVKYLVDIGSGLGHLSRIAGYGFGLKVLAIESQAKLSSQAEKLDKELESSAKKYLSEFEMEMITKKRPIHVQKTLTYDLTPDEFVKFVKESFNEEEHDINFGIVGLHPCGNLALTLLNFFIHCEDVKFINLVGCCYHKMSVLSESSDQIVFPLSNFCRMRYLEISYEARALACHALETYCKRLQSNDYNHLKIHCYRATLELIISKNWPNLRKTQLNNVKHGQKLTFSLYCEHALKKLKLSVPEEDLCSKETLKCLSQWKDVVMYYSMRLMLAPLIETVILLDRILYILENGNGCNLQSVFEPEISPRNLVLNAMK